MEKVAASTKTGSRLEPLCVLSDTRAVVTAEISVRQWLKLPSHPKQSESDTLRHAQSHHWTLIKRMKGIALSHLSQVTAAYFDGVYYKVDGHARAQLWKTGQLKSPAKLTVTLYRVGSLKELNDLYAVFHNQPANKRVAGSYAELSLPIRSKRLKQGYIIDALNIALRGTTRANQDKETLPEIDISKAVSVFKDELVLLDSIDPQPEVFQTGIIAAALVSLSLNAQNIDFFTKLSQRKGNKHEGRMDPVEAVLVAIDKLKHERTAWGNAQQEELCGQTFRALEAWEAAREGKRPSWFKAKLRAHAIQPLIAALRAKKGIEHDPDL